jgi:hypothetical protein
MVFLFIFVLFIVMIFIFVIVYNINKKIAKLIIPPLRKKRNSLLIVNDRQNCRLFILFQYKPNFAMPDKNRTTRSKSIGQSLKKSKPQSIKVRPEWNPDTKIDSKKGLFGPVSSLHNGYTRNIVPITARNNRELKMASSRPYITHRDDTMGQTGLQLNRYKQQVNIEILFPSHLTIVKCISKFWGIVL